MEQPSPDVLILIEKYRDIVRHCGVKSKDAREMKLRNSDNAAFIEMAQLVDEVLNYRF